MDFSLKLPKVSSFGYPLLLKLLYHSISSSVILTGVQCERRRSFTICRLFKNPWYYIGCLEWLIWLFNIYGLCSEVHLIHVPEHISLAGGRKPSSFPGPLLLDSAAPDLYRVQAFIKKRSGDKINHC